MNSLADIKQFCLKNDIPIIKDETADFICEFIRKHNIAKILELGSAVGYSSLVFADVSKNVTVTTIELDSARASLATENVTNLDKSDQITVINDDALNVKLDKLDTNYDLIFIDGPKAQYINCFNKYSPLLSDGGFIITDNLNFHGMVSDLSLTTNRGTLRLVGKIRQFITFLKGNTIFHSEFYKLGDGLAVSRFSENVKTDQIKTMQQQLIKQQEQLDRQTFVSRNVALRPATINDMFIFYDLLKCCTIITVGNILREQQSLDTIEQILRDNEKSFCSENSTDNTKIFSVVYQNKTVGIFETHRQHDELIFCWAVASRYKEKNFITKSIKLMSFKLQDAVKEFVVLLNGEKNEWADHLRNIGFKNVGNNQFLLKK